MITGAHSVIFSRDADADRAFFHDILKLTNIDAGDGWLIFGLPSSEVAVHPSDENDVHQFYLMCDDIEALVAEMSKNGIECGPDVFGPKATMVSNAERSPPRLRNR